MGLSRSLMVLILEPPAEGSQEGFIVTDDCNDADDTVQSRGSEEVIKAKKGIIVVRKLLMGRNPWRAKQASRCIRRLPIRRHSAKPFLKQRSGACIPGSAVGARRVPAVTRKIDTALHMKRGGGARAEGERGVLIEAVAAYDVTDPSGYLRAHRERTKFIVTAFLRRLAASAAIFP